MTPRRPDSEDFGASDDHQVGALDLTSILASDARAAFGTPRFQGKTRSERHSRPALRTAALVG